MARPNHVPKFGNWDANDHIPFTAVFESARAGKVGKMINPNDPSENPAAFAGGGLKVDGPSYQPTMETNESASAMRPHSSARSHSYEHDSESIGSFSRPPSERRFSRDNAEHRHQMEPSGRTQQTEPPSRKSPGESIGISSQGETRYPRPGTTGGPLRTTSSDAPRKGLSGASKENGGPDYNVTENRGADQSPLHHQAYQGRLGNKPPGSASPAWERKGSADGGPMLAPATPGRTRMRGGSARGDDTPDRGVALPKFGEWNDKDPSSGEGFTIIFNQARTEKKQGGPVRIPALQPESPAQIDYGDIHRQQLYATPQKQPQYMAQRKGPSRWTCCFSSSAAD